MTKSKICYFVALAITSVCVCYIEKAKADVVVGVILSLTGPASSTGNPIKAGLAVAPSEVAGQKIRYIVLDSASDPSHASRAARKLIVEEKADIILGDNTAPNSLAIAAVAAELDTPHLSAAPIYLPPDKADWSFQVAAASDVWMRPILEDMKAKGVKNVGFIGFSDAWGDLCYQTFARLAPEYGLELSSNERFARSDVSISSQVLRVLSKKPDAVFAGTSTGVGSMPHIALKDRKFSGPIYNTPGVLDSEFMRLGGKAIDGALVPASPGTVYEQLPDSNPIKAIGRKFASELRKESPNARPTYTSGNGYDMGMLVANAVEQALQTARPGTKEFRVAVRDGIASAKDVPGVNAIYHFKKGATNGVDNRSIVLLVFKDREWRLNGK